MSLLYGHCNTTQAYTHSSAHTTMHRRSRARYVTGRAHITNKTDSPGRDTYSTVPRWRLSVSFKCKNVLPKVQFRMLGLRTWPRPLHERVFSPAKEEAFFLEFRVKRCVPVLLSCTVNTLQGDVWTAATMSRGQQNWQEVCSTGAGLKDPRGSSGYPVLDDFHSLQPKMYFYVNANNLVSQQIKCQIIMHVALSAVPQEALCLQEGISIHFLSCRSTAI